MRCGVVGCGGEVDVLRAEGSEGERARESESARERESARARERERERARARESERERETSEGSGEDACMDARGAVVRRGVRGNGG